MEAPIPITAFMNEVNIAKRDRIWLGMQLQVSVIRYKNND